MSFWVATYCITNLRINKYKLVLVLGLNSHIVILKEFKIINNPIIVRPQLMVGIVNSSQCFEFSRVAV